MTIIAEALNERKDCYAKAKILATQIAAEAVVEKKNPDTTVDTINDLLVEFDALMDRATYLTVAINEANNREMIHFGKIETSLMAAIAMRDELTLRHSLRTSMLDTIDAALGKGRGRLGYYGRKTKDDIKEVSLIDRDQFRKDNDALAEQRRQLDIEIQKVNWSAEL